MRLNEAAMCLRLYQRQILFDISRGKVYPGRQLPNRSRGFLTLKNQIGNDGLHPRCSAIEICGDYDVVVSWIETGPVSAVQLVILIGVLALWQLGRRHHWIPRWFSKRRPHI